MAENQFPSTIDSMFDGLDRFISTKTVVGEPVKVDDVTLIPLIEASCAMGAGAFGQSDKGGSNAGGLSAKIVPSAILVIRNGTTKLINIKHQDAVTKIIDMVPDFMNRVVAGNDIPESSVDKAKEYASGMEEEVEKF